MELQLWVRVRVGELSEQDVKMQRIATKKRRRIAIRSDYVVVVSIVVLLYIRTASSILGVCCLFLVNATINWIISG